MKSGIRTTEFWLAVSVAVMGALAAVYAEEEWARVAGIVAAALSSAGYGLARAQVKSGVDAGPARMLEGPPS